MRYVRLISLILFWPGRGCIYAVWTLSFLTQHKEVSDPYFTNPQKLTISGETKFDLNSSGQVLIKANSTILYEK